jgi:hypothetical protein
VFESGREMVPAATATRAEVVELAPWLCFNELARRALRAVPPGAMEPAGYGCCRRVHRSDLLEHRHQRGSWTTS